MAAVSAFFIIRSFCKTSWTVADSKSSSAVSRRSNGSWARENSAKRSCHAGRIRDDFFSSDCEAGLIGAGAPERLRRGSRYCRGRVGGRRPFRRLILAVAGERGPPSREGAGPWRHNTQSCLLVLGAKQCRDALVGYRGPEERLHSLYGALVEA